MGNKKIILMLFLALFLISFASALEFDNVKSYDPITREAIITNTFGLGTDIGKARLNTPLNYKVAPGYQKVAEFDLWAYKDYEDIIKSIEFYDKTKADWKKNQLERTFDLKYKTYENVLVDDFKTECSIDEKSLNKTQTCQEVKVGSHYEEREVWNKITPSSLKKNEHLTIGIFTEVKSGDYVEWIPQIYGVKINEWASWESSVWTNLTNLFHLDEGTGNAIDSVSLNHLNLVGSVGNRTGIINYARGDYSTGNYFTDDSLSVNVGSDYDFSLSIWFNAVAHASDRYLFYTHPDALGNWGVGSWETWARIKANNSLQVATLGRSSTFSEYYIEEVVDNEWHHLVYSHDAGVDTKVYFDGVNVVNLTQGEGGKNDAVQLELGYLLSDGSPYPATNIFLDEFILWSRTLTQSEITSIYRNGTMPPPDNFPTITLNSPSSANYTTPQNIQVNFTASDDINLSDVKLYVNGALNQTNASGLNNSIYLFDLSLGEGDYTIYGKATDNESQETNSDSVRIIIDSTPFIDFITPPTPVNYANIANITIEIKVNVSTNGNTLQNISYDFYNTNGTLINYLFTNETYDINISLPTAHFHYNVTACVNTGKCNSTETRHLNHDVEPPQINLTSPRGVYNYLVDGYNLDINWTVSDIGINDSLDSCWYIIPTCTEGFTPSEDFCVYSVKNIVTCSANHTTFNLSNQNELRGTYSLQFGANDTFGNIGSNTTTWTYKVLETSKEYNNETIEGKIETFKLYLTKATGVNVQNVVLHYGGQTATSSLFSSGDEVRAESELFIDNVLADTNNTFYFTVTLSDSTVFNTTSAVQLVRNVNLDDCSVQPYLFLNLSLVDEADQTAISGDIEVFISIINPDNFQEVLNINNSYSNVSSKVFCSNILLNESSFLLGAKIRYNAEDHSAEFYNIQRSNLSSYPKKYVLYDLKDEDTTKFKLIYRGDNLVGVVDAIIQLQREYISEGIYKIVEAPLTSSESTAVVHIDTDTHSYKATVVKDGVLLDTFENLVFICQSELTGECTLDLQDFIVPPNSIPIETLQDFAYSISSDIDNKTITLDYSVPTGTTSSITVVAIQEDIVGEETICNTTISSAGGSIECTYEDSIQDSYISYIIYKDGTQLVEKSYVVSDDLRDDFGGDNYFILIVFAISLIFMAILSPEWIVLNSIISIIIGGATWLLRGMDFVLGLGAIAWLLLGAIIVIIKMSQKEDQ